MSARIWPDTLPDVIRPGYQLQPVEQSIRTTMEAGNQRLRRITHARGDSVDVAWRMSDTELHAFRAWHGDEAWSLAGPSDDLTGWWRVGATLTPDVAVGPAGQLADAVIEDTADSVHRIQLALPQTGNDTTVAFTLTLQGRGRDKARVGLLDRAGQLRYAEVDLAAGTVLAATADVSVAMQPRGGGWWRVVMVTDTGTGSTEVKARVVLMNQAGQVIYPGDGLSGVALCEVNLREATGHDLFLPTGTDGSALGAAGGSAWFTIPLAFGGGFSHVEARFEEPFSAVIEEGLWWSVRARLEVRHA